MPDVPYYRPDLARIHHEGFGFHADAVAPASSAAPGPGSAVALGTAVVAGQAPQLLVPARVWQRTRRSAVDALVTCVVSPAFDFADFELRGG